MAMIRHVVKPFEDIPGFTLILGGGTLTSCCGVYTLSSGLYNYPNEPNYKEALARRDLIFAPLLDSFLTRMSNTSFSSPVAGHQSDPIAPTMFILSDYVPKQAKVGFSGIDVLSDLSAACKPYFLAKFISENPRYGTITSAPSFRVNGNYHRLSGKKYKELATPGMEKFLPERHVLQCWIWQPNQELVQESARVKEYATLEDVFACYEEPKVPEVKVEKTCTKKVPKVDVPTWQINTP